MEGNMLDTTERSKILASLAVFRQLYNSKKDVYGVISEFLNNVIDTNALHQFNSTEITDLLNSSFGFNIPEAVVRTSINRVNYLRKRDGIYFVDPTIKKIGSPSINSTQVAELQENNKIFEDYFRFIESETNTILSESQKEQAVHAFCSFLLDESNGNEYSAYISSFLIKSKQQELLLRLNQIREGLLLYSGLIYNNVSETGSWKTALCIYLDTEVLFNLSGFNGEFFKNQFDDLYKYVHEINSTARKRLIQLFYFKEVKEEVENFFTAAQLLVEGKISPDPSKTAMNLIVKGCNSPSDIVEKKADFYRNLTSLGIFEGETIEYYDTSNHKYNIMDVDTIKSLSSQLGFDVTNNLRLLNYISIHRGESNDNKFEDIQHILLTGKSNTIKVSWSIRNGNWVPLATTTEWLTNKFWFKLNKGFGNGDLPRSVNIITKAQMMLSAILNESIGEKYDELTEKYKKGELTDEIATSRLISLRDISRKPEDIKQEEVSLILNLIHNDSLERFVHDYEIQKNEANASAIENEKLKFQVNQLLIENKKKDYQQKSEKAQDMKSKIESAERIASRKYKMLLTVPFALFLVYYIVVFNYSWDILEKWTYLISTVPFLIALIYMSYEKEFNPKKMLKTLRKKLIAKEYVKLNISQVQYNTLLNEIGFIESEIKELEAEF